MTNDDVQCTNIDLRFVVALHGMEVRRRMFPPEHLDDDNEKLTDGRHASTGKVNSEYDFMVAQQVESAISPGYPTQVWQ